MSFGAASCAEKLWKDVGDSASFNRQDVDWEHTAALIESKVSEAHWVNRRDVEREKESLPALAAG